MKKYNSEKRTAENGHFLKGQIRQRTILKDNNWTKAIPNMKNQNKGCSEKFTF